MAIARQRRPLFRRGAQFDPTRLKRLAVIGLLLSGFYFGCAICLRAPV